MIQPSSPTISKTFKNQIMTIAKTGGEERLIILPDECDASKIINTFTLPPCSNIESKPLIELFENTDGRLYQVKSFQFGKGPSYSHNEDLANDKYHYAKDDHPIKSTFIVNNSNPADGCILNSSKLYFCTLHDVVFSLIGFLIEPVLRRMNKTMSSPAILERTRLLTGRTMRDFLQYATTMIC